MLLKQPYISFKFLIVPKTCLVVGVLRGPFGPFITSTEVLSECADHRNEKRYPNVWSLNFENFCPVVTAVKVLDF